MRYVLGLAVALGVLVGCSMAGLPSYYGIGGAVIAAMLVVTKMK